MIPPKVKVKGQPELLRDTKTQAVINTDRTSLEEYKKRRDLARKSREEMDMLKNDVSEIKQMLLQLLQKDNK